MMPQYLLTGEEYSKFLAKPDPQKLTDAIESISLLRAALLKANAHVCIHNTESGHRGYCDHCPVAELMGDKAYSKTETSACPLPKGWSK